MQTSVKNWATKHCRAQGEFKMVFQLWWALETIGFVRSIIFLWPCISWATEEMLSLPQHSGCPVECCESDKPAKLTFAALFLVFVYPLLHTLKKWRAYRWSNFTFGERNVLKTHAKNSPSSTSGECKSWWKYTKNLTFVFELLFKIFICAGKPIELEVSIYYNNK